VPSMAPGVLRCASQALAQVGMVVGNTALQAIGGALQTTGCGAVAEACGAESGHLLSRVGQALGLAARARPVTTRDDDAQDELRRLRQEVARLRGEAAAAPPTPPRAREVVDTEQIDGLIAAALQRALGEDSRRAKRPPPSAAPSARREADCAEEDGDEVAFMVKRPRAPEATPKAQEEDALPKARPRTCAASAGAKLPEDTRLPTKVTPAVHGAFLEWCGTTGRIVKAMDLAEWARQVGKRYKLANWQTILKRLGVKNLEGQRHEVLERALAHFLAVHPDYAEADPQA